LRGSGLLARAESKESDDGTCGLRRAIPAAWRRVSEGKVRGNGVEVEGVLIASAR
jgi:hypothetical protein